MRLRAATTLAAHWDWAPTPMGCLECAAMTMSTTVPGYRRGSRLRRRAGMPVKAMSFGPFSTPKARPRKDALDVNLRGCCHHVDHNDPLRVRRPEHRTRLYYQSPGSTGRPAGEQRRRRLSHRVDASTTSKRRTSICAERRGPVRSGSGRTKAQPAADRLFQGHGDCRCRGGDLHRRAWPTRRPWRRSRGLLDPAKQGFANLPFQIVSTWRPAHGAIGRPAWFFFVRACLDENPI